MIRRLSFATFLIVLFVFFGTTFSHAQTVSGGDSIGPSEVSIIVSPKNPHPGDTVTVTLSSLGADISGATISWTLQGKKVLTGTGKTDYSFPAKSAGTPYTISATIVMPDASVVTKTATISPESVDILWQAVDSVVPPLYRGKALPSSEATIKFVAIPGIKDKYGSSLSSKDIVYNWTDDYTKSPDASGYGKDFFTTTLSSLHPTKYVGITAESVTGSSTAESSASITAGDPFIRWYEMSPLYGPRFDQSFTNDYTVNGSEVTVFAEPYFFSPNDPASKKLSYAWTLNGGAIDTPVTPNVLFLHRDNNSGGDATLGLAISSVDKLFEEATASLTLHLQ